ncbi:uncharacterized protein FIBRA_08901 [Fibroporia radiculosa]|uniref:Major facilitator superfamily (MFS) profile domain-containing protein n=1 Tax=Fibroporia radiculosa TaxID=599839 RepID=J4ICL5_9APHY|nr:uncharacterized protein FIBRA_08901 [Fibroporia radiculosa]CCM06621.1 predicted protein [Fibroporia radiculosa]
MPPVLWLGILSDWTVYSVIVPVIPFQIERMGYSDVSGLTGWLLFAFSIGTVVLTPPIAILSERYRNRQVPLICGQLGIIAAQILFMESPTYWPMIIARILQGFSSSVVWVVGLALVCDTIHENSIGRHFGLAMSGAALGTVIGPPVSGALYTAYGFRAPFIFGIIFSAVDLVGRLLVIERKHALRWGIDPAALPAQEADAEKEGETSVPSSGEKNDKDNDDDQSSTPQSSDIVTLEQKDAEAIAVLPTSLEKHRELSLLETANKLMRSRRALATCACALLYAIVLALQEPVLPLHMQAIWNYDSTKVGLVYMGFILPGMISSIIGGWLVDKRGPAIVGAIAVAFSMPWFGLLILDKSAGLFIAMFALSSLGFTSLLTVINTELSSATRMLEGVGFAHTYGVQNMANGLGSAVGPIISGQLYDHLGDGWTVVSALLVAIAGIATVIIVCCFEEETLLSRMRRQKPEESTIKEALPEA